jgi:putative ABC transport system permease protein
MGFFRRFVNILRPARLDREFEEELEFHRQMRLRKARERGLTEAEAERETGRRMGSLPLAKEEMRDARVIGWLDSTLRDLRHGVVLLRRDAATSALCVLVLALGIGGNAVIFTLLKAAYLDPLPFRDSGRLVAVARGENTTSSNPSVRESWEIRARSRTLEQVAFAGYRDMQLSGSGEPVRVYTAHVTASFFPVLGVAPGKMLGRTFLEDDNQPGRVPSVILSNAFWRSQLNADPGVTGRTLRLDGQAAQVVGVLPPDFHFDYPTLQIQEPVDVYFALPLGSSPPDQWGGAMRDVVIARLRDGVTLPQVETEMRDIGAALVRDHPEVYHVRSQPPGRDGSPAPKGPPPVLTFQALPLRDAIVGPQRALLGLLSGAVIVLLLIACANTAQLLLARSLRRGREVAIRAALGASRLRLIRQFLLEGLVLAACGAAAGLLLTGWLTRLLVALLPVRNPLLESAHLDVRVVGFTCVLAAISALIFAIVPAIKGSRWTPGPSLTSPVSTSEGSRWRHGMIALEAALSVFLLCGAGLVAQNLWTLITTPTGFDPNHVLAMQLKLPSGQTQLSNAKKSQMFQEYLERIAAIPGVESAATITSPPMHRGISGPTEISGVREPSGALKSVISDIHQVSPDYFRTMHIPLLAGRTFRSDDVLGRPLVQVVNEEFARQFGFTPNDAVGHETWEPGTSIPIVGVVGNVRTRGLDAAPYPEAYLSSAQMPAATVYLVVRSAIPPAQLVRQVKTAVASSNADQAVYGVLTMDELIADSVTQPRFSAYLIGAFALLAVTMAAAGMYSVISCLVTQRTSEIAIRMALGAGRSDILRTVMGATSVWVVAGLAGGVGLGLAARNAVRSLSSSVAQGSVWMYAGVVLFFFVVTLVSAYMPMRRASRLDPAAALRCE